MGIQFTFPVKIDTKKHYFWIGKRIHPGCKPTPGSGGAVGVASAWQSVIPNSGWQDECSFRIFCHENMFNSQGGVYNYITTKAS